LNLNSSIVKNIKIIISFLSIYFAVVMLFTAHAQKSKGIRKITSTAIDSVPRTALVIGNANYDSSPLKNPVNDAIDMANSLRELDFDVTLLKNVGQDKMRKAINNFGRTLRGGGVGLFYFSGHGMQVNGQNFLIPVGAPIESEEDVEIDSVAANRVLAKMDAARNSLNIVILDACRNNPFARSFRSASRGLASMAAAKGSFIAYATASNDVAADGTGGNSPYTRALVKQLKEPGLKLEDVFKRTSAEVQIKTNGKQVPWFGSNFTGDFYFVPPAGHEGKVIRPIENITFDEEMDNGLVIVFKKKNDSNLENLMQNLRPKIYAGITSLDESNTSFNLNGFSEISTKNNFHRNLEKKMKEKSSNSSLVFNTDWDFKKSRSSSMWEGLVSMDISIDSYLLKKEGLMKIGSYSVARQRIPIDKWGDSSSFKERNLQRITDKVIKKWSDENLLKFIQSIK
jgi:hypothetical protein